LAVHGEAIYGTVPWVNYGEGPTKAEGGGHFNENNEARFTCHDLRYTTRGDALYVTALGRPGEVLTCTKLAACHQLHPDDILKIQMLGGDGNPLKWTLDEDGLNIEVPEKVPSTVAVSFKITTRTGI